MLLASKSFPPFYHISPGLVHLIYFEDMTYSEAAKVMRKNRKQVDNLLQRAKKELRIILGKDGELLV